MRKYKEAEKHMVYLGSSEELSLTGKDSYRRKYGAMAVKNRLGNDGQRLEYQPRSLNIIPLKAIWGC